MTRGKLIGVAIFLVAVYVAVPWGIAASGRWDFYYTLTSVALLSIASAGVWLTFYIGRINIGQGAYALVGGYVSADPRHRLRRQLLAGRCSLAGLFCAGLSAC